MNAKHTSLSDGKYNAAGSRLKSWMEDRNLQFRNPFMLTHETSRATHSSTTIDLVVTEPDKAISVRAMHITTADHRALCIATRIRWRPTRDGALRYNKVDWNQIRTEITLMKEEDSDPRSVQLQLTAMVVKHTPRGRPNAKAFWNRKLEKERKELMKAWRTNPLDSELSTKKKTFRKPIAEAKMESNARCLQEETDPECLRRVKPRASKHLIPALERPDGTMVAEHQHIAEELHSALYQGQSCRHSRELEPPKEALNMGNLDAAFKESPNGAATRPDHIPTRMIREFRRLREKLFMTTMNRAWTQGLPSSWKSSSTILIPKLNKPAYTIAKSWRPIQLQSILAKVLERAVVDRIARLDILPDNMYGGRNRFGTTDAIQRLNDIVTGNPKEYTCFTALDIERGVQLPGPGKNMPDA